MRALEREEPTDEPDPEPPGRRLDGPPAGTGRRRPRAAGARARRADPCAGGSLRPRCCTCRRRPPAPANGVRSSGTAVGTACRGSGPSTPGTACVAAATTAVTRNSATANPNGSSWRSTRSHRSSPSRRHSGRGSNTNRLGWVPKVRAGTTNSSPDSVNGTGGTPFVPSDGSDERQVHPAAAQLPLPLPPGGDHPRCGRCGAPAGGVRRGPEPGRRTSGPRRESPHAAPYQDGPDSDLLPLMAPDSH